MTLNGLHLLLTYTCILDCDHCFLWGNPMQSGAMTATQVESILRQAREVGSIRRIDFEGGEPFLYYPLLVGGVREARRLGFRVGAVTNAYWATSENDAVEWLKPFTGILADLSISHDAYHDPDEWGLRAANARSAAERLGIRLETISIAPPEEAGAGETSGVTSSGTSPVRFRGRAARRLAARAPHRYPAATFDSCPWEDLREPGRLHVDALGNLQVCQGITIGNLFRKSLKEILDGYDPRANPVVDALLEGGPAALATRFGIATAGETYADACHLCYETRDRLRSRFPDILTPDQAYGVVGSDGNGNAASAADAD